MRAGESQWVGDRCGDHCILYDRGLDFPSFVLEARE